MYGASFAFFELTDGSGQNLLLVAGQGNPVIEHIQLFHAQMNIFLIPRL